MVEAIKFAFPDSQKSLGITLNPNNTTFNVISHWSGTGGGTFNSFCLMSKAADLGVWASGILGLAPERVVALKSLGQSLCSVKDWLIIQKIISYTLRKWKESLLLLLSNNVNAEEIYKRKWLFIYDALDLGLDLVSFSFLFRLSTISKLVMGRISNIGFLILHSWNLRRGLSKLGYVKELARCDQTGITREHSAALNTFIKEAKRSSFIKISLAVANVAKDLFILISFVTGAMILSPFAFWSLGASVVVLRSAKEIYDDSATYKRVNLAH